VSISAVVCFTQPPESAARICQPDGETGVCTVNPATAGTVKTTTLE